MLNTAVAVLVLSLPFAATAASRASTVAPNVGATTASDGSRAQLASRGAAIGGSRNPLTVAAEGTRPVQEVTIHEGDTLATMANYYDVSVEAIAFANGMTNERSLRWTLEAGIRPIPNQMFGFPDDDFDSIRDNIAAWKANAEHREAQRLGHQVWYEHFELRIAKVERAYSKTRR